MKFSEKLTKLRKKNNLSQEALAERLNMSRQAISKWESGNSYPDMTTMINVCKILNCTIDELLDDDAIGNNTFEKNNKNNPNKWIKDFLHFITKTYNMFWSMKLTEKIKCIIEISIIAIILFFIFFIFGIILRETVLELFNLLPYDIYYYIYLVFKTIYSIISIITSFIIFIHLFKIRYLDYYVTIEDQSINNKIIEKEIEYIDNEKNEKKIIKPKNEKIIIRDPKHTTYSFFSGFAKMIMFILKIFTLIMLVPFTITFILFVTTSTISLIWIKYGFIFFGILITAFGCIIINYIFIELMYKFIFNKTFKFKRTFILFIIGLFIFGIGCGLTLTEISTFKIYENNLNNKTSNLILEVNEDTVFNELEYTNIIIDNKVNDIIINVIHNEQITPYIEEYKENEYYLTYDFNDYNIFKYILEDIKLKRISNYDIDSYEIKNITISQKNYDLIIRNNKNIFNNNNLYD